MWTILESKIAARHINKLPKHILEKYEFWRSIAQISGPDGLKQFPGFKDHGLRGEWTGHRSSYLNDAYRVIYRLDRNILNIYVIDVNHHDYRKK